MDVEKKSSPENERSERAMGFINQAQLLYPKAQLLKDVKAKAQYIRAHGDIGNSDVVEQILMFEEVVRILQPISEIGTFRAMDNNYPCNSQADLRND